MLNPFRHHTPEQWLSQEDHVLEDMAARLRKLPDYSGLTGEINELRNSVLLLQKKRSTELANNVHERLKSLRSKAELLAETFGVVEKDSEVFEQLNQKLNSEYLTCLLKLPTGEQAGEYVSKQRFYFGTKLFKQLPTGFTEAMFSARLKGDKIVAVSLGEASFRVNGLLISKNNSQQFIMPLNSWIRVEITGGSAVHILFKES